MWGSSIAIICPVPDSTSCGVRNNRSQGGRFWARYIYIVPYGASALVRYGFFPQSVPAVWGLNRLVAAEGGGPLRAKMVPYLPR